MSSLTNSAAWRALSTHHQALQSVELRTLFAADPQRAQRYQLQAGPLFLDYSKNRITDQTLALLLDLAHQQQLPFWRGALLRAEPVNHTEHRAALHTALRRPKDQPLWLANRNLVEDVHQVLERMRKFCDQVRSGTWRGYQNSPIRDVVNIGIGGSDLGPAMVCAALPTDCDGPRLHFVSNVDGANLWSVLRQLNPATTLFIVASKTFTTAETLLNAHSARQWLRDQAGNTVPIERHFVAVSTNRAAVEEFGINPAQMFEFWDWVGGRYSLWSAIGLPIALAIGMEHFESLLAGAYALDCHFEESPLASNMPVIMALLTIWSINFEGAQTQAILPYDQGLRYFVPYIQQLGMESTGKAVTRSGAPTDYHTGAVLWGGAGTDGQHAYFQLLHQGTIPVPADFIAPVEPRHPLTHHHSLLMANFLAQSEALMRGKSAAEAAQELQNQGISGSEHALLLPHKVFPGNRPSNTLLFQRLDPYTLGALIALYEHRTFVQSVLWDINAFDQWGVELGKQLARNIISELRGAEIAASHDSSTRNLIGYLRTRNPGMVAQ